MTNSEISAFRFEAFNAGDALMGYICSVALGETFTEEELAEDSCLSRDEQYELLGHTQETAKAEVESVRSLFG